MKKRSLTEDVKRIQILLYGKSLINEQQKVDEPKKADYVTNNVDDFFKTLDTASKTGLKQQSSGSMGYQKEVESMQIGLMILGYSLPQHGIDGLFGGETGAAVSKFITDNSIKSEPISGTTEIKEASEELRTTLDTLGYKEKGSELTSGGEITDEISGVVSQILKDFKAISPNVGVTITSGNDRFHKGLNYKSKHTDGKAVDAVLNPYNSNNASDFKKILDKYKSKISDFTYIDEYTNPSGAATGGHFHLQYGKGLSPVGGANQRPIVTASSEMINKLIDLLKARGIKPEELKTYVDSAKRGNNFNVDVKDWQGMVNLVIDNLEGGYYHPDMLQDGRVNDQRYGNSGETMFGLDRMAGGIEATGPAGREFWSLIDSQNAKSNWKYGYMAKDNPSLESKLRELASNVMKPLYGDYTHRYLSPEAAEIVNNYAPLAFNFIYGTWNGPGWFQKFAKVINDAVAGGNTDPKSLLQIALERRSGSGNSLIAQGGSKVANISNSIASSTSTMV